MKFPWVPKSPPTPTPARRPTVRDLTDQERADIEYFLAEGQPPSQVAQEQGFDLAVVQNVQRMRQRTAEPVKEKAAPVERERYTAEMSERQRLRDRIEIAELEAKLDRIKADNEFEKEKRELELEIKRAELEARRAEALGYEDGGEDDEGVDLAAVAADPEAQMWGFLSQLLVKNASGARSAPQAGVLPQTEVVMHPDAIAPQAASNEPAAQPNVVDVRKPLSDEHIRGFLRKATPAERMSAKAASDAQLAAWLSGNYPGITKTNIARVTKAIRAWKE